MLATETICTVRFQLAEATTTAFGRSSRKIFIGSCTLHNAAVTLPCLRVGEFAFNHFSIRCYVYCRKLFLYAEIPTQLVCRGQLSIGKRSERGASFNEQYDQSTVLSPVYHEACAISIKRMLH